MPTVFGEHATSDSYAVIEPGMYDATIESVSLVRNADGTPKETENGKEQADVRFLTEQGPVRRRYSISFGQNQSNGLYAQFAKFIEAATGVKCGDSGQRKVSDTMLVGKNVRIVVDINERGYNNVTNVMAPAKGARPAASSESAFGDEGLPPEPHGDDPF